ncbi:RNA-binding motif protein, X-linked 2 [Armadillidium vulgare]|nr:RNA-binding motif protein, X-linked 2 [Armadillidium vulgare]
MNPLTNVKNIEKLSKLELDQGIPIEKSWHQQYRDSAWIFFGGLNYDLTEGDVICVFSQYGEVANINLIRDHKTGKSKGFGFLCYEDQRSTILAVDNLNGIKKLFTEGCAPQPIFHHNQTKDEEVETLAVIPKAK